MESCNQEERMLIQRRKSMFSFNCKSVAISSYAKRGASFANILFIAEVALIRINNIWRRASYISHYARYLWVTVLVIFEQSFISWHVLELIILHGFEPQSLVVGITVFDLRYFIRSSLTVWPLILILRNLSNHLL